MASSDKIKAGEAYIEANLEDATFRNKLKRMQLYFTRTFPRATKTAEKAVRAFGATVATVATAATAGVALLAAGLVAVGAAAVGGVGYATTKFLELSAEISKTAAKAGIGVEALSELQYAASQFGAEAEDVSEALLELRRRIAEGVSDGAGPAINGLRILGLELHKIAAMKPDEQLEAIATAMKNLGNNDLAAFAADELFGSDAEKFLPLLMQGAEGIRALRREARELGVVIESEDVEAATRLQRVINQISSQFRSFVVQVGAAFAPALEMVAKAIQQFIQPALRAVERILEGIEETLQGLIAHPERWRDALGKYWNIFRAAGLSAVEWILSKFLKGIALAVGMLGDALGKSGYTEEIGRAFKDAQIDINREAVNREENAGFLGQQAVELHGRNIFPATPRDPVEASRPVAPIRTPVTPVEAPRPDPVVPPSIAAAGTFSGRAASFLGKSDPVVTELKDANKTLTNIERNTREGGMAFT